MCSSNDPFLPVKQLFARRMTAILLLVPVEKPDMISLWLLSDFQHQLILSHPLNGHLLATNKEGIPARGRHSFPLTLTASLVLCEHPATDGRQTICQINSNRPVPYRRDSVTVYKASCRRSSVWRFNSSIHHLQSQSTSSLKDFLQPISSLATCYFLFYIEKFSAHHQYHVHPSLSW
jgi:hypothetical protein